MPATITSRRSAGALSAMAAPSASAVRVDDPDTLDGDTVDSIDLGGQQRHQVLVGEHHGQFVDGTTSPLFEDLDRQHVAAHRADSTGDLAERTGTVGHPDPYDDRDHGGDRTRADVFRDDRPVTIALQRGRRDDLSRVSAARA
jgi:hypothetical protein